MQQAQREIDLRGLTLVAGVFAWLIGIFIGSFGLLPAFALLSGAAIVFIFSVLLWHEHQSRLILCLTLCLLLGAWRYSNVSPTSDPLALSGSTGQSLVVRGSVTDEPKLYGHTRLLSIAANSKSLDGGATWQDTHGQLTIQTPGTEIENPYSANYGSVVELQGKLLSPLPHSSPEIQASMFFPRVRVTGTAGNPVLALLFSWRIMLSNIIVQVLPQPDAALLIAILLGLKTPSLHPLSAAFNATGTTHLIAPDGFKITILAGLVANSIKWLYKPNEVQEKLFPTQKRGSWRRWLSIFLILASIAIYTILCGAGAAAIRAGVMGSLLVIAPRIGRTYNIYTALAFIALLLTLYDPFTLWDISFQLSFLGTLGIVLFTPFFQRLLLPLERIPLGHIFSEIIAITLAAQIATLPLLALDFQQLSLIAFLTNVLTVPLLSTVIMLGVLICSTGLVFLPLTMLIGWVTLPLLTYITAIVQWSASLPEASIPIGPTSSGLAWCYYALLALIMSYVRRKWPLAVIHSELAAQQKPVLILSRRIWQFLQLSMGLVVIATTSITALQAQANTNLTTLTFLNVTSKGQSQGEALLLRTPDGKTLLIDGGLDATSLAQELDNHLPTWQRSLDAVILTTPRQDHLNGLLDIVQRYTIGEVIDGGMLHPNTTYAHWRRTISERNIRYLMVSQNTSISIGKFVFLQILWPVSPLHKSSNEIRDDGLILRIITPGLRFLLIGAAAQSKYALSGLLNTIDATYQQAEIVQMIEESNIPFSQELDTVLERANPALLVMTPATLPKKQARPAVPVSSVLQAIPTLRTTLLGTIEISSNQQGWWINST